jgi:type IV secretory pathway TrbL component
MYGMKSLYHWIPIDNLIKKHPLSIYNYWDIGRNYHHKDIILAKTNPSNTFPMLNFIGQKHGWISKTINTISYKVIIIILFIKLILIYLLGLS